MNKDDSASKIMFAEELLAAEDNRFVDALRQVNNPKRLALFADRWKRDRRPWSQSQKIEYLRGAPKSVGHQPVIKRLFKQAEEVGDDSIMAVCAALFDRLVRHEKKTRWRYDWRSRDSWQEEYLAPVVGILPTDRQPYEVTSPWTGKIRIVHPPPPSKRAVYFSYRTRYYLQRRACRYFRRLAIQKPDRYIGAVVQLLHEYQDDDFERGERILDAWTLLQLAFRHHPALKFERERVRLAEGGALGQLKAAPRFPELWRTSEAFSQLTELLQHAPSRLVRVWSMQMIEQDHQSRLATLPTKRLLELLTSTDPDVQEFASRLLKANGGLHEIPLSTWLQLLEDVPPTALAALCEIMQASVSPDQLNLQECVALALQEPSPIAELGLQWLKSQSIKTEDDHEQLARLASVKCIAIAEAAAEYALQHVGSAHDYDRDHVSCFFDSLSPTVRRQAWKWLVADDCPGAQDPILYTRLLETPFDDLRLGIIELLERRSLPGEARSGLISVWASVLLGVHRGGRQKLIATRQLADEIRKHPEHADDLLPILVAAVRSVRQPESRAGLAALVISLLASPELQEAVRLHLPELEIVSAETIA